MSVSRFLAGFVVGGAIGAVAGILCTTIVGGAVTAPVIGFLDKLASLPIALIIVGVLSFGYIGFIGLKTLPKKG